MSNYYTDGNNIDNEYLSKSIVTLIELVKFSYIK